MSSPRRMYLTRGGRGVDALFVCNVRVTRMCDVVTRSVLSESQALMAHGQSLRYTGYFTAAVRLSKSIDLHLSKT